MSFESSQDDRSDRRAALLLPLPSKTSSASLAQFRHFHFETMVAPDFAYVAANGIFTESAKMQLTTKHNSYRNLLSTSAIVCMLWFPVAVSALATGQYTDKQLEAFEARVGKIYWVRPQDGKMPAFLSAPSSQAATVTPAQNESFEILELYAQANKEPYYKVKFDSGQLAYIQPEQFHEQFNLTITSIDPLANEKRRAEEQSKAEKERVEWINAQPWSPQVKQAAVNKKPTPGLNAAEVKRILGEPRRTTKVRGATKNAAEEQWFYPDGTVLIFTNGLLSKTEQRADEKK